MSTLSPTPLFVVVGHPNKGKSSLVSTLAQDDTVRVSPEPGTTTRAQRFPMRVDGELLYTLVDTPGFQRARAALAWLRQHQSTAAQRPALVRQFVEAHRGGERFLDEVELLAPVLEGGGILYVVDGSRPYGPEYEAEMELLRWTGQPSMALINPIASEAHVEEWRTALGQYFQVVRVFNAMTAPFEKQLELLRAFGELNEPWRAPLAQAVASLERERARQRRASARIIARTVVEMMTLVVTRTLSADEKATDHEPSLRARYENQLRIMERQARDEVEAVYGHHHLERHERDVELLEQDLFSRNSWLLWGLTRGQVLSAGAMGGAMVGGGIDLALHGATVLMGTLIGAAVGGASAWLGYDPVSRVRMMGLSLGRTELRAGPARNVNFPFVVLGRALHHHAVVCQRTHAQRGEARLEHGDAGWSWTHAQRRELARHWSTLRRHGDAGAAQSVSQALASAIEPWLG
jgi:hypothetical protein